VLDTLALEAAGVPTAVVCSSEFVEAARAQARALGYMDFDVVSVGHPLATIPPEEVERRARDARPQIARILTRGGAGSASGSGARP
jgi:hypothetical protein